MDLQYEQERRSSALDTPQLLEEVTKEQKIALSISKLKAARYLDFGLEELVPSLWVESERDYDISAAYGITHWWFRRKEFYINKHSEPSDREAVRSQMRVLSIQRVQDLKKIFKKSSSKGDFEDLFLLNIQEKLNHVPTTDKTSLHTAVNMWIRNLVIKNHVGDLQLGIENQYRAISWALHIIDSQGLHVDPAKIEAVKNWASPTTPT
ncbi:hypothetical protein Tco_1046612 [Tanacetum coccineum]